MGWPERCSGVQMTVSPDLRDAERFRGAIARSLGLHFDETKLAFLSEHLKGRLKVCAQSSEAYLARLEIAAPREELRALAQTLTVAETYFFRNSNQFRAFREVALPDRCQAQKDPKRLRILSAGCASGEEPYSIAIEVQEALGDVARDVSIRAVDLNPAVLDRAKRARYSSWALRETPPEVRDKWFRPDGQGLVVLDPTIRGAVNFEEGNLIDEDAQLWRSGACDIIFCRNVLMYFAPDVMQTVVARLSRALTPGGYLFLGHAETLRGISQDFHLCHTHDTFYYRLKEATERADTLFHGNAALGMHSARQNGRRNEGARGRETDAAFVALVQGTDTWADVIHRATERIRALRPAPLPPAQATLKPNGNLALALELLQDERYVEALALVQALPTESSRDPDVRLLHALLLTHSLELGEAERLCQQLLADDNLNAGAHYLLALCRERAGDCPGAVDHDQYAVYLDPAFAMPRLHLGLLARRNRDPELARRELSQALVLLQREDPSRLLLFGGGFNRETLLTLCRAELQCCGGHV
jgi:chemotaxis protein methyltransferase CheR